jgi:hypothetical protein
MKYQIAVTSRVTLLHFMIATLPGRRDDVEHDEDVEDDGGRGHGEEAFQVSQERQGKNDKHANT